MVIQIHLRNKAAIASVLLVMFALIGILGKIVIEQFVIFALSDYRKGVETGVLAEAVDFVPNSPRLLARLAASEIKEAEPDLISAEQHALHAIRQSPNNFNYQMLLGEIRDLQGDQGGAEQALRDALRLAPDDHVVHWRIANLLIRQGKTQEAIDHFRFVAIFNQVTLPGALDLVWQASGQDIPSLTEIVRDNPKAQLKLALFLANKSRADEAAEAFAKVDNSISISSPETSLILDALIAKGFPKLANNLWWRIKNPGGITNQDAVWNGDFEAVPLPGLKQFEWRIEKSEYARISIDSRKGHSGTHSLLIDFLGRDTTRLGNEIRQLVVLRPGIAYQLDFFAKTENFQTPVEGPGVVVAIAAADSSGNLVGQSKPISLENTDWQQMSVNFTTPRAVGDGVPLFISFRRQPLLVYDDPTRGRIWFDDFTLREVSSK